MSFWVGGDPLGLAKRNSVLYANERATTVVILVVQVYLTRVDVVQKLHQEFGGFLCYYSPNGLGMNFLSPNVLGMNFVSSDIITFQFIKDLTIAKIIGVSLKNH